MDRAGRLVIPKAIRHQAGLRPGTPLEVRWQDGRIEIEPAPVPVSLVRRGRLLVAVPAVEVEPLTAETIEATRRGLQLQREDGV
jgi:AbrB family looped-hinge helix DNA binding protein